MRTCRDCDVEKDLSDFGKMKSNKEGKNIRCKICMKIRNQLKYVKNGEKYYTENKEDFHRNQEKFNGKNPNYQKEYLKIYQKTEIGKQVQKKASKKYSKTENGKKSNRKSTKKRTLSGKSKAYTNKKYHSDPFYKLKQDTRNRINMFYKSKGTYKNGTRTEEIIGCSWQNYNDWIEFNKELDCLVVFQTDHVIPLTSANNGKDMIKLCNWKNTMPTTCAYNLEKHDRLPTKHELFKQDLRLFLFKRAKIVQKRR